MRLTKNRLQALNTALSIDDILYEKYRRLNQDLQKQWQRLYRAKQVIRVVQKRGKIRYQLQITDIHISPDGTIVEVSG